MTQNIVLGGICLNEIFARSFYVEFLAIVKMFFKFQQQTKFR